MSRGGPLAWASAFRARWKEKKRRDVARKKCRRLGHVPGRPSNVCALCGDRLEPNR